MPPVVVLQALGSREQAADRITGPIVIDLTGTRAPVVDDEFVVEWQISEPAPPPAEAAPAVPSPA